ncbi:MAG TPA: GAF domain-containing protein [Thermomicrobiales bacterium]|jgi:GGDEF domain-containing protein|nr:GAF domain-containing protein [Thermomicrobiales bacterium]
MTSEAAGPSRLPGGPGTARTEQEPTGPSLSLADLVLLGLLLTLIVSVSTWAIVSSRAEEAISITSNVFVTLSTLVASILTLVAALRGWLRGTGVQPWLGLTIACHAWLVGEIGRLVLQHYLDRPISVPTVIDVPLLFFAPAALWAFLPMFRRPGGRLARFGMLLDLVIVLLLALLIVSAPVSGGVILDGAALATSDRLLISLWFLSAVVTLLPAFALTVAARRRDRPWAWPLAGGFLLLGVGQVIYADAQRSEPVALGYLVTSSWSVGFALIASSAVIGARHRWVAGEARASGERPVLPAFGSMPVVRAGTSFAMAASLGVVLIVATLQGSLTGIAVVVGTVAVISILARLIVSAAHTELLLREVQISDAGRLLAGDLLQHSASVGDDTSDPIGRLEAGITRVLGARAVRLVGPPSNDAGGVAPPVMDRDGASPDLQADLPLEGGQTGIARIWLEPDLTGHGADTASLVESISPQIAAAWGQARREGALAQRLAQSERLLDWQSGVASGATPTPGELVEGLRGVLAAQWLCIEAWDAEAEALRMVAASPSDLPVPALSDHDRAAVVQDGSAIIRRTDSGAKAAGDQAHLGPAVLLAVRLRLPSGRILILTAGWDAVADGETALAVIDPAALAGVASAGLVLAGSDHSPASRPMSGGAGMLAGILGDDGDERAMLTRIADHVVRSTPANQAAILIWSPIGDEYEVAATGSRAGHSGLFISGERSAFSTIPTIRNALAGTGPTDVTTTDTGLSPAERRLADGARVARLTSCPLIAGGRRLGVMVVGGASPEPWPAPIREAFEDVATLAAVVVERGRLIDQSREAGTRDDLTGVLNQRSFQAHVTAIWPDQRGAGGLSEELGFVYIQLTGIGGREQSDGPLAGERLCLSLVQVLREVGGTDAVIGQVGLTGFGMILPERSDFRDLDRQIADGFSVSTRSESGAAEAGLVVRSTPVAETPVTLAMLIERATGTGGPVPSARNGGADDIIAPEPDQQ